MASFITPQETLPLGIAGSISRLGAKTTTRTLNQAAGVAEGLLVVASGTAGQECKSPASAADVAKGVGFTIYRPMSESYDDTHHYADNEAVAIMEEGHMHVNAEGTCVADAPVFVRVTSDGGDNTVLGKVLGSSDYPSGGIVITPTAVNLEYNEITLSDGTNPPETFTYLADGTASAQEIVEGLQAKIDASANFAATEDNSVLSITSTTGIVEVVALSRSLAVTTPARAVRVPGCFFDHSRTGAGLVEIRLNKQN